MNNYSWPYQAGNFATSFRPFNLPLIARITGQMQPSKRQLNAKLAAQFGLFERVNFKVWQTKTVLVNSSATRKYIFAYKRWVGEALTDSVGKTVCLVNVLPRSRQTSEIGILISPRNLVRSLMKFRNYETKRFALSAIILKSQINFAEKNNFFVVTIGWSSVNLLQPIRNLQLET